MTIEKLLSIMETIEPSAKDGAMVSIPELKRRGVTSADLLRFGRNACIDLHRTDFPAGIANRDDYVVGEPMMTAWGETETIYNTVSFRSTLSAVPPETFDAFRALCANVKPLRKINAFDGAVAELV
jgi:hypothetical protein